jgi:predicted Rossmann fold flavoprotein
MKKVIVVGGGASGMMAAIKAGEKGNSVTLIEKNERLGKKLFITGKGRCNVTTDKNIEEIIENIPGNSSFLYSALYTFTNDMLMKFIEDGGVKLKVERGGRVFPESDKSSDIIRCFERYLQKYNVDVMLNTKVTDVISKEGSIAGVELDGHKIIECDCVILSTGGMSYPLTGSTGDGYRFAERLGHSIKQIKPSLIPLTSKDEWVKELMGLSLKNVEVTAEYKNKLIYKEFGEMLFTHFGLSGPVILSASRKIQDYFPDSVDIFIDLKPALNNNELDKRILKDFEENKNRHFKNSLDELLPSKLIPVFIRLSGIDPEKQDNSINREERQNLVKLFKRFRVSVSGTRPIAEAIITRGGVNVKEVDPGTMESKIIKGLHLTGELLDVDALTGGFNLQIAFSTGYCAGMNC